MLLAESTPISAADTAATVHDRLAELGGRLIVSTLDALVSKTIEPVPQPDDGVTYAHKLGKEEGLLDWRRPARDLVNLVRGCNPWPGATASTPAGTLTVWRARAVDGTGPPGTLIAHERSLAIATGAGAFLPLDVQPESRRTLGWDDYLRGARLSAGRTLMAS
jgi:methionyl-tRNA formyltransferase